MLRNMVSADRLSCELATEKLADDTAITHNVPYTSSSGLGHARTEPTESSSQCGEYGGLPKSPDVQSGRVYDGYDVS